MKSVIVGIDRFAANPSQFTGDLRVGLICNQASVNSSFHYTADVLAEHPSVNLTTLFGPQHGIRGDVQDNMIESGHSVDGKTGLPVYSLYSEVREPTVKMLENVDALLFDLQDIGGRVYTFIYTMANSMRACASLGKKFLVLDRPNPINGIDIEGSKLLPGHESFVGQYPIPMRHGMTAGELAMMFNSAFEINCDLEVVRMEGWERSLYQDETTAPWVMPSPNMPTVDSAVVFPGTVFVEGTEVSEGRGTTRPFELIGAPYVDGDRLADDLNGLELPGVYFRPVVFIPTFQKFAGKNCGGVFVHVTDRNRFKPVISGLAIIKRILNDYSSEFLWKQEPYEYEFDRNPFDVIAGNTVLREQLESDAPVKAIAEDWKPDEESFVEDRREFLLY
ncbi:MAG: DUF1343 domain-containing protein [Pyrinomonadaceae bacterium]